MSIPIAWMTCWRRSTGAFHPYVDLACAFGLEQTATISSANQQPSSFVVDPNTEFSSWQRIRELVEGATTEVWAVDPFISSAALPLFLPLPSTVSVRLLTVSKQAADIADWTRFVQERGGASELRLAAKSDMFHDRFLGIDGVVYMSGSSFKDIGRRFSALIPRR